MVVSGLGGWSAARPSMPACLRRRRSPAALRQAAPYESPWSRSLDSEDRVARILLYASRFHVGPLRGSAHGRGAGVVCIRLHGLRRAPARARAALAVAAGGEARHRAHG